MDFSYNFQCFDEKFPINSFHIIEIRTLFKKFCILGSVRQLLNRIFIYLYC